MIKVHYNTTKNAHKGFTVVKMPLKHGILKKNPQKYQKNIFKKKQNNKSQPFQGKFGVVYESK